MTKIPTAPTRRTVAFAALTLLPVIAILAVTDLDGTTPFASDGCTLFPDGDWGECCRAHDFTYWAGGPAEAREEADHVLGQCIIDSGHPIAGRIITQIVRITGTPWLPTYWRWGFGRPWPAGYE
ncbi:MAG: FAD-binding oxidoreductase [Pseudomonadota bacterium]|nr:FAD-binding oxidoreductase [Pseudomonadota bacterium]